MNKFLKKDLEKIRFVIDIITSRKNKILEVNVQFGEERLENLSSYLNSVKYSINGFKRWKRSKVLIGKENIPAFYYVKSFTNKELKNFISQLKKLTTSCANPSCDKFQERYLKYCSEKCSKEHGDYVRKFINPHYGEKTIPLEIKKN